MTDLIYEQQRILALRRFGLLDTAPEAIFDGIVRSIANICEVPIALFTLVDSERQWFKSAHGLEITQTPRDIAFCNHAIADPDELLLIEDTELDDRFVSNPLVVEDPRIRFYAGKSVLSDDGYPLGTLCVIDREPRSLSKYQTGSLVALSETISHILAERERIQKIVIDRNSTEDLLHEKINLLTAQNNLQLSGLQLLLDETKTPTAMVEENGKLIAFNPAWEEFVRNTNWKSTPVAESNLIDDFSLQTAPFNDSDSHRQPSAQLLSLLNGRADRVELVITKDTFLCARPFRQSPTGVIIQLQPIA